MDKTNYSVARVQTYTRASIQKAERHNERKNVNMISIFEFNYKGTFT